MERQRPTDPALALDLWWALPKALAGMPMPMLAHERRERPGALKAYKDDLPLLAEAGIGAVVCLLNLPRDGETYGAAGLGYQCLPIPDGHAPSLPQFIAFLQFLREQRAQGRAVAVHCAAGLGRTGTMLAGCLIASGLDFQTAVRQIRAVRPGAIETSVQMKFLSDLPQALRRK
ncbi:MAG: dual specificity protein phosphatase family protein [Verrucomicrobia bacterium]|nr:dual specificity protein phosphatase family protein [Verrucomicrobiota bacterium]